MFCHEINDATQENDEDEDLLTSVQHAETTTLNLFISIKMKIMRKIIYR